LHCCRVPVRAYAASSVGGNCEGSASARGRAESAAAHDSCCRGERAILRCTSRGGLHRADRNPFQELEFDFLADNPGLTLFHCHQQLHMDFGFMALFTYA
jgi:hypothetical protein